MPLRSRALPAAAVAVTLSLVACGPRSSYEPPSERVDRPDTTTVLEAPVRIEPYQVFHAVQGVRLGAPLAVAVDFEGVAVVADGSPGRVVAVVTAASRALEFQEPANTPGFYPTDVGVRGFFVYAIDETSRRLLRFDRSGGFRDVLLNFEALTDSRRVSPYGLAVDETGRIAVTDIENHQVLLINNYLQLDVAFGHYGSFEGQLNEPLGVSFTRRGDLLVADTGNRRVQYFSEGGAFLSSLPAPGAPNPLRRPRRAVESSGGVVFVADPEAGAVFALDPAGSPTRSFAPAGAERFEPTDVEVTRDGTVLVTDAALRSLYVFKGM